MSGLAHLYIEFTNVARDYQFPIVLSTTAKSAK